VAAQLVMYDGPDQVIKLAHRLGIESELQPNASIALGTSEVSLMELTASYAAFMNGGYKATPHVIRRVTTAEGKVLYENTYDSPPRVLSEQIAAQMDTMMMGVIESGTGKSAKIPGWQAAGKTGTTQNSRDALFVGFTSNLTTGVWFGNDDGKPMKKVTGGGLPAKAWKEFMIAAHKGLSPAPLFGNGQLIADPNNGQPMAQTAPGDGQLGSGQPMTAEAPPSTIGGIISGVFGGNDNANRYPQAPARQQGASSGNGGPVPPADIAEGGGANYEGMVPPGDVGGAQTTSSVQPRRTTLLDLIMGQ
jgi:penicillin-binding protein 1A